MVNNLATFTHGPLRKIFVQTFLSGTAKRDITAVSEPTRISFEFVDCPQLSLTAISAPKGSGLTRVTDPTRPKGSDRILRILTTRDPHDPHDPTRGFRVIPFNLPGSIRVNPDTSWLFCYQATIFLKKIFLSLLLYSTGKKLSNKKLSIDLRTNSSYWKAKES